MSYKQDCLEALKIAKSFRTHADAIKVIIARGLAEDPGEADRLIYEGEEHEQTAVGSGYYAR
tara:strand:+ start:3277 stop:3462 length:186 start_codon:yes stop_codon:yes gene_type:complete